MKFPLKLSVVVFLFLISCNKNNNNEEAIEALSGHWHVWDFEPNSDSPVEESALAKASILKLVKESCDPVEFTFYTGGEVFYIDGMRFLDAAMVNEEVNVDCAPEYDEKIGTFDFDNSNLTLKFDSETIKLEAKLDGDFFITQVVSVF